MWVNKTKTQGINLDLIKSWSSYKIGDELKLDLHFGLHDVFILKDDDARELYEILTQNKTLLKG